MNTYNTLTTRKTRRPMTLSKIIAYILGAFTPPLYIWAWLANLDNIKSTILFIMATLMGGYRFFRWCITSIQNKRLKDIEIKRQEYELRRQELELLIQEGKLAPPARK